MPPTTTQPPQSTTTGISSIPADILDTHILTRLDGPTLASATSASTLFSSHHLLWSTICHSTWPSTTTNQITNIISTFSDTRNRYQYFFSQSFPLPTPDPTTLHPLITDQVNRARILSTSSQIPPVPPSSSSSSSPSHELISAVDIHYLNIPIFTKTEVTETVSNWFMCSPFRIDMINPKNVVTTPIPTPVDEATWTALMEDVTLSWILIDPINKRSVNLSSIKPVFVNRHWLSGEVELRFGSVVAGDGGAVVECRITVSCGGSEDGMVRLQEVVMEMEGMDGKCLDGRGSLVILHRVMKGKRGIGVNREDEGRRRYRRYEEMKRERREKRERKSRVEGTFDILTLVFGLCISIGLFFILIFKNIEERLEKKIRC